MPRLLSLFLLPREEDGHFAFTPNTILKKGRTSEVILPREKRQVAKTAMRALQREEKEQKSKFGFFKTSAQSLERYSLLPGVGAKVFCL